MMMMMMMMITIIVIIIIIIIDYESVWERTLQQPVCIRVQIKKPKNNTRATAGVHPSLIGELTQKQPP